MANYNQSIYDDLVNFGIDPEKAKRAATKFNTLDRAANWVLDGGGSTPAEGERGPLGGQSWETTGPSSTRVSPSSSPPRIPSPGVNAPYGPHNQFDSLTDLTVAGGPDAISRAYEASTAGSWNAGERGLPSKSTGTGAGKGTKGKRLEDMTFEEQMEMAMANSTQETSGPGQGPVFPLDQIPPANMQRVQGTIVRVHPGQAPPQIISQTGHPVGKGTLAGSGTGATRFGFGSGSGSGTPTHSAPGSGYASLSNSMTLERPNVTSKPQTDPTSNPSAAISSAPINSPTPPLIPVAEEEPKPSAELEALLDADPEQSKASQEHYRRLQERGAAQALVTEKADPGPNGTAPVTMGSNNPFLSANDAFSSSTLPLSPVTNVNSHLIAPPLPVRKPPILAKDISPHMTRTSIPANAFASGSGTSAISGGITGAEKGGPAGPRGVSFGRVSDDVMNEEGRMIVRVDDQEDEEDRTRRGRSPTPASAKRARVSDPSPDPLDSLPMRIEGQDSSSELEAALALSLQTQKEDDARRGMYTAGGTIGPDGYMSVSPTGMDVDKDVGMAGEEDALKSIAIEDAIDEDLIPDREPGHPCVFASQEDDAIYACHVLQILLSVPQFARLIPGIVTRPDLFPDFAPFQSMAYLFSLLEQNAFGVKAYREISKQAMARFSVMGVKSGLFWEQARDLLGSINSSWCTSAGLIAAVPPLLSLTEPDVMRMIVDAHSVFESSAFSTERPDAPPEIKFCLDLVRDATTRTLSDCLDQYIWGQDITMGIESLADVFCLTMRNAGDTELLYLDEELYLDRYLAINRNKMAIYRETANNVRTELFKLSLDIDKMMWADVPLQAGGTKRVQIDAMLASAIAHFEGENSLRSNELEVFEANLMVEKLRRDRETLRKAVSTKQDRHTLLVKQLPNLFKTPELMHHKYLLRGVAFHAGFAGTNAFASYWRDDTNQWWRGQGFQATKTDMKTLNEDTTGLWFNGGPYFLVYSRDGPRPEYMPSPVASTSGSQEQAGGVPAAEQAKRLPTLVVRPPPSVHADLLQSDSADASKLQEPISASSFPVPVTITHVENAPPENDEGNDSDNDSTATLTEPDRTEQMDQSA